VSSSKGTAARRPPRRCVSDWEPSLPPLERQTRVLRPGWLEILAGDNDDLRNPQDGKPLATKISAAAGLDRTSLTRIINGQNGLSLQIVDALIRFLEVYRGMSAAEADGALFERVSAEVAA
jgi:hypothetical protein